MEGEVECISALLLSQHWEIRASRSIRGNIRGSKPASAKEASWNTGDPASRVK